MGKKASIWIMSVLFSLGIFAAYHADSNQVNGMQAKYQRDSAAPRSMGRGQVHADNSEQVQVDLHLNAADNI